MSHKTLAIAIDPGNLQWLQSQTRADDLESLSKLLNELIASARGNRATKVKSVVGKAHIVEDDPELLGADHAIRALFDASRDRFTLDEGRG